MGGATDQERGQSGVGGKFNGVNLGSSKAYLQCDNYTYLTNEIFGKICKGKFSVVRFL